MGSMSWETWCELTNHYRPILTDKSGCSIQILNGPPAHIDYKDLVGNLPEDIISADVDGPVIAHPVLSASHTVQIYDEAIDAMKNYKQEETKMEDLCLAPRRIIFDDPVTVVFWEDGSKTIVRRAKGEKFNKYTAFCAALAKKVYGNNTQVNKIVAEGKDQKALKEAKAKKKEKAKLSAKNEHVG